MRATLPLFVLFACHPGMEDGAADPPLPPEWDSEADPIDCAWDAAAEAPLMDLAAGDADRDPDEIGYSEAEWRGASYRTYLDDAFLLPWFRDAHWHPLRLPCLGGQTALDLDAAAAAPHPVATALGEAMALLEQPTLASPLDPRQTTQGLVDLSDVPDDLATALTPIFAAMVEVATARGTMAAAAPDTAENLVTYGHGGVILDFDSAPDLSDAGVQNWVLSEAGPRVLFDPARVLAFAIEEADLMSFAGAEITLDQETALGRVIIAGPGSDAPGDIGEIAFYLDMGGDDTYVHPTGASSAEVPVAVHIDLGGADDYGYTATDPGSESLLPADGDRRYRGDSYYGKFSLSSVGRQGSGRFGVGMSFDMGGEDDTYASLRMSQGWAQLGVGVLFDDGGDDAYLGEAGVQGAASMGIGLMMDAGGGADEHRAFAQSQGFGYVQAVGVAWDGGGDDDWYLDPGKPEDGGTPMYYSPQLPGSGNSSFGQGVGFGRRDDATTAFLSGGVGVLRDAGGDDTYTASTFAQGSGYWQGLGMLLDGEGSDLYDAYYYVQGGAAHYAIGMLLDDGPGDDGLNTRVTPNNMHFGAGHDFSVGVFVDEAGDDTYVYAGLAAGASNCQGVGLMVDNDGSDAYEALSTYSTGLGNHSGECQDSSRTKGPSIGLFLDSGGDADDYVWTDDGGHPVPSDDTAFGYDQNGTEDEHGGGVDGDGETGVHAGGALP